MHTQSGPSLRSKIIKNIFGKTRAFLDPICAHSGATATHPEVVVLPLKLGMTQSTIKEHTPKSGAKTDRKNKSTAERWNEASLQCSRRFSKF
jgi:hypothetical protein